MVRLISLVNAPSPSKSKPTSVSFTVRPCSLMYSMYSPDRVEASACWKSVLKLKPVVRVYSKAIAMSASFSGVMAL